MNNQPPVPYVGSPDRSKESYGEWLNQTAYGNLASAGPSPPQPAYPGRYASVELNRQYYNDYRAQQSAYTSTDSNSWSSPQTPRTPAFYPSSVNSQSPPSSPDRAYHLHHDAADIATVSHTNFFPHGSSHASFYRTEMHGAYASQGSQLQPLTTNNILPNFEQSMSIESVSNLSPYYPTVARVQRTADGKNMLQLYDTRPLIQTRSSLEESPKYQKTLNPEFKRVGKSRKFFVVGKVFMTLWSEPAGGNADDDDHTAITSGLSNGFSTGSFGEKVFSEIRRFVVVREGDQHCEALSVVTYNRQGVSKKGVNKSEHAIIYTGNKIPIPLEGELPVRGEQGGLLPQAIRVDPDSPEKKLDPMSRVDFAKVYTIQHNVKVHSLGRVNRDSMQSLLYQFKLVWARYFGDAGTHMQIQKRQYPRTKTAEAPAPPSQSKVLAAYNALRACDLSPEKARAALVSAGCDLSNAELDEDQLDESSSVGLSENQRNE